MSRLVTAVISVKQKPALQSGETGLLRWDRFSCIRKQESCIQTVRMMFMTHWSAQRIITHSSSIWQMFSESVIPDHLQSFLKIWRLKKHTDRLSKSEQDLQASRRWETDVWGPHSGPVGYSLPSLIREIHLHFINTSQEQTKHSEAWKTSRSRGASHGFYTNNAVHLTISLIIHR